MARRRKWYKENIEAGKELFIKYATAYSDHLQQDLALVKTVLLAKGLINITSEECYIIEWSKKDIIKKALRSNDFYDAKTIASVLCPDSLEQQEVFISKFREGREKLNYEFEEIMQGIDEMHKYASEDFNYGAMMPLGAIKQHDVDTNEHS